MIYIAADDYQLCIHYAQQAHLNPQDWRGIMRPVQLIGMRNIVVWVGCCSDELKGLLQKFQQQGRIITYPVRAMLNLSPEAIWVASVRNVMPGTDACGVATAGQDAAATPPAYHPASAQKKQERDCCYGEDATRKT